jgi:FixJ family two-component response regulator
MVARKAGAHAFLAKPYLIEELDEALEQAVRRYARARPQEIVPRCADIPS